VICGSKLASRPPVDPAAARRYPGGMKTPQLLVLGTRNRNKVTELAELLRPHGLELRTLADFPHAIDVVEDGQTFAENAAKKAIQQAHELHEWVLGEDSGLVVDALDGAPGVYSARFSGTGATDRSNNEYLLGQLADVPLEKRTAHYVCHMTLADSLGNVRAECEAYCRGRILHQPAGEGGFGYDPLFEVIEYRRTFGQLGLVVKGLLSHRGRAVRRIVPQLVQLVDSGQWERAKYKAGPGR
jgi:XTP/dITP diphosphohydrolase